LLLPFSLCLSIYLCDITFCTESYLSESDEFIRQWHHLLAHFLVRLPALIYVLLYHLRIIIHPHLTLAYRLNHIRGLLRDPLDDTLQVLYRLHPLIVLIREEVLHIDFFLLLYVMLLLCRQLLMLDCLLLLDDCVELVRDTRRRVVERLERLLVEQRVVRGVVRVVVGRAHRVQLLAALEGLLVLLLTVVQTLHSSQVVQSLLEATVFQVLLGHWEEVAEVQEYFPVYTHKTGLSAMLCGPKAYV
jgi:hypothetical protein